MAALSPRQESFVRLILAGVGQTEAFRQAGFKSAHPAPEARKLAHNPRIIDAIAEARRKAGVDTLVEQRAAIAAETAGKVMSAQQVLEHLTAIAAGEVQDTDAAGASCPPRLADRLRALELIGRKHKMFTDKVEHSGGVKGITDLILMAQRRRQARQQQAGG